MKKMVADYNLFNHTLHIKYIYNYIKLVKGKNAYSF